jgi:signal transduction histidine kinase
MRQAESELRAARAVDADSDTASTIDIVVQELSAASQEITDLVAGVPPARLGGGRLRDALKSLAARSPVSVSVAVAADVAGDRAAETTLFYVCSEALANAVKHARASRVAIDVVRQDDATVATIADDGCGGADPSGSGLQGLADRLAAENGWLQVDSPPGAGTTVTAMIPR